MLSDFDIEGRLALWDSLNEEYEVWVPITLVEENPKLRALFVERVEKNKDDHVLARVFVEQEEALAYRKARPKADITFVRITLRKLAETLNKSFSIKSGKRLDCVLSNLDKD